MLFSSKRPCTWNANIWFGARDLFAAAATTPTIKCTRRSTPAFSVCLPSWQSTCGVCLARPCASRRNAGHLVGHRPSVRPTQASLAGHHHAATVSDPADPFRPAHLLHPTPSQHGRARIDAQSPARRTPNLPRGLTQHTEDPSAHARAVARRHSHSPPTLRPAMRVAALARGPPGWPALHRLPAFCVLARPSSFFFRGRFSPKPRPIPAESERRSRPPSPPIRRAKFAPSESNLLAWPHHACCARPPPSSEPKRPSRPSASDARAYFSARGRLVARTVHVPLRVTPHRRAVWGLAGPGDPRSARRGGAPPACTTSVHPHPTPPSPFEFSARCLSKLQPRTHASKHPPPAPLPPSLSLTARCACARERKSPLLRFAMIQPAAPVTLPA